MNSRRTPVEEDVALCPLLNQRVEGKLRNQAFPGPENRGTALHASILQQPPRGRNRPDRGPEPPSRVQTPEPGARLPPRRRPQPPPRVQPPASGATPPRLGCSPPPRVRPPFRVRPPVSGATPRFGCTPPHRVHSRARGPDGAPTPARPRAVSTPTSGAARLRIPAERHPPKAAARSSTPWFARSGQRC